MIKIASNVVLVQARSRPIAFNKAWTHNSLRQSAIAPKFFSSQPGRNEASGKGVDEEPEVQIEVDAKYHATSAKEDFERAYKDGGGAEQSYDFSRKRLTITNWKNVKSDKISTIQIDGLDRKVSMLTTEKNRMNLTELGSRLTSIVKATYLPKDYPDSVSKEFLPFTIYSLIGGVSTSAMLFLSTQSLFVALGGSANQAQLAAAAYTWVIKDCLGQLGGIIFASRYGGYFDEDIKKWRFFAMSTLNLSILVEILTLKYPHLFLLLASTANMGKNVCFLMAAASRAQINMRFAKRNNIADIAGKSVSMFTTSSLVGMTLGMGLSKLIDISQLSQMAPVFAVLTFVNLYSTYTSANLIDEVYLNNQRAKLLFDELLAGTGQVPTMKHINDRQNFTVPNFMNWHYCRFIRFGEESISRVIGHSKPSYYATSLLHQLHKENRSFAYYIRLLPWHLRPFKAILANGCPYVVHLNMKKEASNTDQLAAYYLARLLDLELQDLFSTDHKQVSYDEIQNCIRKAELQFSQVDVKELVDALEAKEWSLDYIYLDRKHNVYDFKLERVEPMTPTDPDQDA